MYRLEIEKSKNLFTTLVPSMSRIKPLNLKSKQKFTDSTTPQYSTNNLKYISQFMVSIILMQSIIRSLFSFNLLSYYFFFSIILINHMIIIVILVPVKFNIFCIFKLWSTKFRLWFYVVRNFLLLKLFQNKTA